MPESGVERVPVGVAAMSQNGPVIPTDLRQVDYHNRDAQLLIDQVQQEYVLRYGGPDATPVDRDEFSPPTGHFVVLYEAGRPVAMGGWRFSEEARAVLGYPDRVVELKRMYVGPGQPRPRARADGAGSSGADRGGRGGRPDGPRDWWSPARGGRSVPVVGL